MLSANPYDQEIAARLLDFFAGISPWNRRLWHIGILLTLNEILEASEAVRAGALNQKSLDYLITSTRPLVSIDPGIGDKAIVSVLQQSLQSAVRYDSLEFWQISQLREDLNVHYLERLGVALSSQAARPAAERAARSIASHMLDVGFDADYLHRWFSYRINHEPQVCSIQDLALEAHSLCMQPLREFEVIVAFESVNLDFVATLDIWLEPKALSTRLRAEGFDTSGLRQKGGLGVRVTARDARSAVESAAEIVDRLISRIVVGTRDGKLKPHVNVWVMGEGLSLPLRRQGRRVEVHALERQKKLYPEGGLSRVDNAIELLTHMAASSPSAAVAGGWAAIEAMLSTPGDENVLAGDRMATLIACSFPRAELTALSYKIPVNSPVFARLAACGSNRDRSLLVAMALRNGEDLHLSSRSDRSAQKRIQRLLAEPHTRLNDVKGHITTSLRRLYRQRNMVLHWGKTEAIALRACLRTAAPLVGEGMDRIAHAWFVDHTLPLELAARASIRLGMVGTPNAPDVIDLLS